MCIAENQWKPSVKLQICFKTVFMNSFTDKLSEDVLSGMTLKRDNNCQNWPKPNLQTRYELTCFKMSIWRKKKKKKKKTGVSCAEKFYL